MAAFLIEYFPHRCPRTTTTTTVGCHLSASLRCDCQDLCYRGCSQKRAGPSLSPSDQDETGSTAPSVVLCLQGPVPSFRESAALWRKLKHTGHVTAAATHTHTRAADIIAKWRQRWWIWKTRLPVITCHKPRYFQLPGSGDTHPCSHLSFCIFASHAIFYTFSRWDALWSFSDIYTKWHLWFEHKYRLRRSLWWLSGHFWKQR